MRISKKAWRTLATAVAVPGSALGALAGFAAVPAMAGTAQPQMGHPATETFYAYGAAISEADIPVYASGAFSDQGYLEVSDISGTIVLRHGDIYFTPTERRSYSHTYPQSCNVTETLTFSYHITGGTGSYAGARGRGHGSIDIWAVVRRDHGTCDPSEPIPNTIRVLLDASGTFTPGT